MKKWFLVFLLLLFIQPEYSYVFANESKPNNNPIIITDSLSAGEIQFKKACLLLSKSLPDDGLPILFGILEDENASPQLISECNIYIAEAYRQKQEYKKGHDILFNVLKEAHLSKENQAFVYSRISAIFNESNNLDINNKLDSVIKYSNLSIDISRKEGFSTYLALSLNELGFVYLKKGELKRALAYCMEAYDLFIENHQFADAMNTSINLSNILLELHREQEAEDIIIKAMNFSEETESKNIFMRLHLQMASIYKQTNEFKKAYEHLEIARKLQLDFYHARMKLQINEMSAKYDLQLKENEIREEQQKNKIQQQRQYYLLIILFIVLIIFISANMNFRLKRKNLLQKRKLIAAENTNLKNSLKFRNRELTSNALTLARNSEFIISISEKLKILIPDANEKLKKNIMEIIAALNSQSNTKNWEEFETRFEKVHDSFYTKLRSVCPSLSPTEIKICALLRLNLSTKDIATLTSRSVRTIENTRQNIRKKLSLDTDTNLVNYLYDI
jgi:DNA-binding CsgD family transcriptional regulator/tetratricopeptide (TPR) repeat protein